GGGGVLLVFFLVLVAPVGRPAAPPAPPTEGRALAGALPAAGDRAARRTHSGADHGADRSILDDLGGLVRLADLGRRVAVARVDDLLRGHRRNLGRRRGLRLRRGGLDAGRFRLLDRARGRRRRSGLRGFLAPAPPVGDAG